MSRADESADEHAARIESGLVGVFARIAPRLDVRVRAAPIDAVATFAHAEEERAVAAAVAGRRREFATGRRLAHELLARLALPAGPILPGPRRAPIWPRGVAGSIAHGGGFAAVAIVGGDARVGIGIDVEAAGPLGSDLVGTVLTASERAAATRDAVELGVRAKLAFCAKECAYKAWSEALDRVLEFGEVEVEFRADGSEFTARHVALKAVGAVLDVDGIVAAAAVRV